jgi:hypothetical protein
LDNIFEAFPIKIVGREGFQGRREGIKSLIEIDYGHRARNGEYGHPMVSQESPTLCGIRHNNVGDGVNDTGIEFFPFEK